MSDPVTALLESCCVRLVNNNKRGTGCFVAPSLVLTCAHVIPKDKIKGDLVLIEPKGYSSQISASVLDVSHDVDEDYCILSVKDYQSASFLVFGSDVVPGDPVLGYGHPVIGNYQRSDGFKGEYESLTGAPDPKKYPHGFYKLKNTQIMSGFSGSPVVSLRTGDCIGIVTESRNRADALGGWAIPASLLLERLQSIKGFDPSPVQQISIWKTAIEKYKSIRGSKPGYLLPKKVHYPYADIIVENFIFSFTGNQDKPKPFGGRKEELGKLDEWLDTPAESPYALITAPAGRGKSTLLVHWLINLEKSIKSGVRKDLTIIFAPVSIRFDFNTEDKVFRYISVELSKIKKNKKRPNDDVSNPEGEHFKQQFSELLGSDQRYQTKVILIIDGLDEAAGWDVNAGMFPHHCSPDIKVLLSAREMANRTGQQWLESLGWDGRGVAKYFQVEPLNIKKLKEALEETGNITVSDKGNEKIYNALFHVTGGDPLMVGLILEELAAHKGTINAALLAGLEPGLDGFFNRWWLEQEQLWGKKITQLQPKARMILNSLALLFSPITIEEFSILVRRFESDIDGYELEEMITILARFIIRTQNGRSLTISHPKFSEYLVNKLKSYGDLKKYENIFLDWGTEEIANLSIPLISSPPAYITRNFALHLQRAQAPAQMFAQLINPGWKAAWNVIHDSYGGYARDIEIVYDKLKSHDRNLVGQGKHAAYLVKALQCAAIISSIRFEKKCIKPGLLESLLKYNVWSTQKALNFVSDITNAYRRGEALKILFQFIETNHLDKVAEIADEVLQDPDGDYGACLAAFGWMKRLGKEGRVNEANAMLSTLEQPNIKAFGHLGLATSLPAEIRSSVILSAFSNPGDLNDLLGKLVDVFLTEFIPYAHIGTPRYETDPRQKLSGEEYQAIGKFINDWISETKQLPFDIHHFKVAYDTQYLEYLLPFLPQGEVNKCITRVLREMAKGNVIMYGSDFLIFSRDYLDQSTIALVGPAIDKLKDDDKILGMLACYPLIKETTLKKQYEAFILENIHAFADMPSTDEREIFFDLLGNAGFVANGLEEIMKSDRDDWYIERPIGGITPYLSIEACERLLKSQSRWRNEIRDGIIAPVLARYASFGEKQASGFLKLLGISFSEDEWLRGRLVLDAYNADSPAKIEGMINRLEKIVDLGTRIDISILVIRSVRDKSWQLISRVLMRTLEMNTTQPWAAMDLLDGILPYLPLHEPIDRKIILDLAQVIAHSGHQEKHMIVRKFFYQLISGGHDDTVEKMAIAASSHSWDLPVLWAIQGFTQMNKDVHSKQIENLMSYVNVPMARLKALAAINNSDHKIEFETLYEELIGLNPHSSTVDVYASTIADILYFLDEDSRTRYKSQITNSEYWSKGMLRSEAVAGLCVILDDDDLEFITASIIPKLRSTTDRYVLKTAVAKRFAALGHIQKAIEALEYVSGETVLADTLGHMAIVIPAEQILTIIDEAENKLYPNTRLRFYRMLLERAKDLDRNIALRICQGWLDLIEKGNKADIYTSLPAVLEWFDKAQDNGIMDSLDSHFYTDDYRGALVT